MGLGSGGGLAAAAGTRTVAVPEDRRVFPVVWVRVFQWDTPETGRSFLVSAVVPSGGRTQVLSILVFRPSRDSFSVIDGK